MQANKIQEDTVLILLRWHKMIRALTIKIKKDSREIISKKMVERQETIKLNLRFAFFSATMESIFPTPPFLYDHA